MKVYYETKPDELMHFGIKGQKWGVRRFQNKDGTLTAKGKKRYDEPSESSVKDKKTKTKYHSTSLRAMVAKSQNKKIDKSFKKWNEGVENRDTAIQLGKKATLAKLAYEDNKNDKTLRADYKKAVKDYKKALGKNTTYRKGVVKEEVGKDLSRKYLSKAKKVEKELNKNPSDRMLQKKYADLMSRHDVERAKARRAVKVASNRSNLKASIKRGMTMTLKATAATAAIATGVYAVNKCLEQRQVTLNGQRISISNAKAKDVLGTMKNIKDILKYF